MKNFQTKLIALAMVAALTVSGGISPAFAAENSTASTTSSTASSTVQNGTVTVTTFGVKDTKTMETVSLNLNGSDAEKEIEVPIGAVFPVETTSSSALSFNCGDKNVGTAGTSKAFSDGKTLFNIMPWGNVGDKTGVYANGVKLFTLKTVKAPFTCSVAGTVKLGHAGEKQLFKETTNTDDQVSANSANGSTITVDDASYKNDQYKSKDNGNGTKTTYFYARALVSSYWPVGIYTNINGGIYRLFVSSASDGSSASVIPAPTGTGSSDFVCDTTCLVEKSCYGKARGAHNHYMYRVTADEDSIVTSSVGSGKVATVNKEKEEIKNGKRVTYFNVVAKPWEGDLYHSTETQNPHDALGRKSAAGHNADGYQETGIYVTVNNGTPKMAFTFATTVNPDLTLHCYDRYKEEPTCGYYACGRVEELYGPEVGGRFDIASLNCCCNYDLFLKYAKEQGFTVSDTPRSNSAQFKFIEGSSRPEDGHVRMIEHINKNTTVAFSEGCTSYEPDQHLGLAFLCGFSSPDYFDGGCTTRPDGVYINAKTGEVAQGGGSMEAYSSDGVIRKYLYF